MKLSIISRQVFVLLVIIFSIGNSVLAQTDHAEIGIYCISVKQGFDAWGSCSSDPDYHHADIKLKFGSKYYNRRIERGDLNKIIDFDDKFKISGTDKNLNNLHDADGKKFDEIQVSTKAGDIVNDKHLHYTFTNDDLVFGESDPQSHGASDPCNNFISNKREGYTMTTTVYIDDPVFIEKTGGGDLRYSLDNETLALKISDFYQNGNEPVLEVKANVKNPKWKQVKGITVNPDATIYLSYEQIAGKKEDSGSNYFKWMGKKLEFRVVKTLQNGIKTFGNIVSSIVFYPEGLQYTIHQTRRTSCHNNVVITVELDNQNDAGYFNLDPEQFYWSIFKGTDPTNTPSFDKCRMEKVNGKSGIYNIISIEKTPGLPVDIYNQDDGTQASIWTMQLVDKDHLSTIACNRTFTIPPKPEGITIKQKDAAFTINGKKYHVPSMSNPFAMLEIEDPYVFAHLRRPYKIKEGTNILATIDKLPTTYSNMTQKQKDSLDAIFEKEFNDMLAQPNNSYRSYFNQQLTALMNAKSGSSTKKNELDNLIETLLQDMISKNDTRYSNYFDSKLNSWWASNPLGQRIKGTQGASQLLFCSDGSFFVFVKSNKIYKAKLKVNGTYDIENKSYSIPKIKLWGISPNKKNLVFRGGSKESTLNNIRVDKTGINSYTSLGYEVDARRLTYGENVFFRGYSDEVLALNLKRNHIFSVNIENKTKTDIFTKYYGSDPIARNYSKRFLLRAGGPFMEIRYKESEDDEEEEYYYIYQQTKYFKDGSLTNNVDAFKTIPGSKDFIVSYLNKTEYVNMGTTTPTYRSAISVPVYPGKAVVFNKSDCIYYSTSDKGMYRCSLNGGKGNRINSAMADYMVYSKDKGYFIYKNLSDNYAYKHFIDKANAKKVLYPDKELGYEWYEDFKKSDVMFDILVKHLWKSNHIANSWYNFYKTEYKKRWLYQRVGVKVSKGIRVNETMHLKLVDYDGCDHNFDITVTAPPKPSFSVSISKIPSNACANDGTAVVTYNGGGITPYYYEGTALSNQGNKVTVTGLGYGQNTVMFTDANGNVSHEEEVNIEDNNNGITYVYAAPQTCFEANGSIRVTVGNVHGSKTYTLTDLATSTVVKSYTTSSNAYTFTELTAGSYKVKVVGGSCTLETGQLEVEGEVFGIESIIAPDVTTLGSTGNVDLTFVNRSGYVDWPSGAPGAIAAINGNLIKFSDVTPGEHKFVAEHHDAYGRTCSITDSFTLAGPMYEAGISLEENNDNCNVSIYLVKGSKLSPYKFRLYSPDGSIAAESTVDGSLSTEITTNGTYTVNLEYGANTANIYSFNYPLGTLNSNARITQPSCPGDNGSVYITPAGGLNGDGRGITYSQDGALFNTNRNYTVKEGEELTYYIKDDRELISTTAGNPINIYKSIVKKFTAKVNTVTPVSGRIVPIETKCANNSDGKIKIENPQGGSGNYSYKVNNGSWQYNTTINGLSAGEYTVYMRDHSCPAIELGTTTVSDPEQVDADNVDAVSPNCPEDEGSVSISGLSGGYGKYLFKIGTNGTWHDTASTIRNVAPGEHDIYLKDSENNCNSVKIRTITINAAATVNAAVGHENTSCFEKNDGEITIKNPSGGSGVYVFSTSATGPWTNANNKIENLAAAKYNVYLKDNGNGCNPVHLEDITISKPAEVNAATITPTDVTCYGVANGSISVSGLSGGSGTYQFGISKNSMQNIANPVTGLLKGTYKVYLRDSRNNCAVVEVGATTINQPDEVSATTITPEALSCNGYDDGKISVSGLGGGTGNFEFKVDGKNWISSLLKMEGLRPGNYNIYLRDGNHQCDGVKVGETKITEPKRLEIKDSHVMQPTCELENGAIAVEVQGGNGLYRYEWKRDNSVFKPYGNLNSNTITNLGDKLKHGSYVLTVRDNEECTTNQNIVLNEYKNPEVTQAEVTDVKCFGESNGEVIISAKGNSENLKRLEIQGSNVGHSEMLNTPDNTFKKLKTGNYEVYAFDAKGCRSNKAYPVFVNQPDAELEITVDNIHPVITKGKNTGIIQSTLQGGNDGLKDLQLLNVSGTEIDQTRMMNRFPYSFDSLYAGEYRLKVTDFKGCSYTTPKITVPEPTQELGFTVVSKNDAKCKAHTGSFSIQGFGGWGDYKFKRASDKGYYSINTFENLYAGSYLVSVRDKMGAIFTDTIIIHEPKDSLKAKLVASEAPTCKGNGSLSVNVFGGTRPYKLVFENETDTTKIPFPKVLDYNNRPAGEHLLMLTDSNECRFNIETSLTDSMLLEISKFSVTYPTTDGGKNGAVQAHVSGGKSPLTYAWKKYQGSSIPGSSSTLSGLSSGHYELTVTEKGGCSKSRRVYLPDLSDIPLKIIEKEDETSYEAKNGYAHLTSGLKNLEKVELIDPDGVRSTFNITDKTSTFSAKNDVIYLQNLSGGEYFVSATNIQGEKAYVQFEIKPYERFYISDVQVNHAKRIGEASGTIKVDVSGGAGGNTYKWESLASPTMSLDTEAFESAGILNNALAGKYKFTATDKYGNPVTETIEIKQPEKPLKISITEFRNESCKDYEDAYVKLEAEGGWGDYQFRQDRSEYYSNSKNWLNLDVREHYFYLTDKMGVEDSVTIIITEPEYLRAKTKFVDSVNCKSASDGVIDFSVDGGTKPYRFAFETAPNVWTKDTTAGNLSEGHYTFVFTDSNNCVGQDTLTVYMPEPDSLLFNKIDVTHTTCETDNGSITVTMQGGTRPYRYQWQDAAHNTLSTDSTVSALEQSGLYFLSVLDFHNCPQKLEQRINPSTNPVITDIDTTRVLCFGGNTGTATVKKADPAVPFAPYQITWSNGDTGPTSTGYAIGTYPATITDTNNCTTTTYFEITQPDSLKVIFESAKDADCYGYNDGFIKVSATGGVGNYRFKWSNGDTTNTADSLYIGQYEVLVTDSNKCETLDQFAIGQPDSVTTVLTDSKDADCYGYNDGYITVQALGGVGGYKFKWSNGDTTNTADTLYKGRYSVLLTDTHNCTTTNYYEIDHPDSLNSVVIGIKDADCFKYNDGYIQIRAEGGVGGYRYKWSNGDTTNVADTLKKGIYSLYLTDKHNCFTSRSYEIDHPDSLWGEVAGIKDAHCFGYNDGFIDFKPIGGVGGYKFKWTNGDTTYIADSLYKGTYSLILTDKHNCRFDQAFEIGEPDKLIVDLGEDIQICPGNTITIDGQEFSTHKWSTTDGLISNERFVEIGEQREYFLEVTNSIGCFAWDSIGLTIGNDALDAEFLMTSESYLGDTMSIFELSNLELDSLKWIFNNEAFIDVTHNELPSYVFELESKQTGIYNVELWAYSGGCISKISKQVEITEGSDSGDTTGIIGYREPLIKSLLVMPNPNDGNFQLKIELREEADVRVVLFSVSYGDIIDEHFDYGLKEYVLDYQFGGLNSGAYVIMLNAKDERRQIKMIIE